MATKRAASESVSHFLHPGHLFVSAKPALVTTILGSCVAVCLFDVTTRLGGINHYVLPHWAGDGASSPRFGNVAMRALYDGVLAAGARKDELRAKLFGGACLLGGGATSPGRLGELNVARALEFLRAESVPVVAQDTGGRRGRKVVFRTGDGSAWVRWL